MPERNPARSQKHGSDVCAEVCCRGLRTVGDPPRFTSDGTGPEDSRSQERGSRRLSSEFPGPHPAAQATATAGAQLPACKYQRRVSPSAAPQKPGHPNAAPKKRDAAVFALLLWVSDLDREFPRRCCVAFSSYLLFLLTRGVCLTVFVAVSRKGTRRRRNFRIGKENLTPWKLTRSLLMAHLISGSPAEVEITAPQSL